MASGTVSYAAVGFVVGFGLIWGGCGNFAHLGGKELAMCAMGGGFFAILGAVMGAILGGTKR